MRKKVSKLQVCSLDEQISGRQIFLVNINLNDEPTRKGKERRRNHKKTRTRQEENKRREEADKRNSEENYEDTKVTEAHPATSNKKKNTKREQEWTSGNSAQATNDKRK